MKIASPSTEARWILAGHARTIRGALRWPPNGDFHIITAKKIWGMQSISTYGPDCKLKKANVITVPNAVGAIQGDRAGNIYIACNVRPKGVVYSVLWSSDSGVKRAQTGSRP